MLSLPPNYDKMLILTFPEDAGVLKAMDFWLRGVALC
jgi:hypothetical protein